MAMAGCVLVTACGSSSDKTAADGASSPTTIEDACTDQAAQPVSMGTFAQPTTLDATKGSGRSTNGGIEMAAIYDTLMRLDTETGTYEPHLAKSLTPNADMTTWTLELRDGVTFGNGDVLDAEAVKASIELLKLDTNTQPSRPLALNIASMEATSPLTLVFTLDDPWPSFPYLLAGSGGMVVNTKLSAERGEGFGRDVTGAGAGPFELVRFAPGEEIVLKAKDDYWGGPLCVSELRFIAIPGGPATFDAFQVGEIDVALLRDPTVIANATDAGFEGHHALYNLASFLLFNQGARGSVTPTSDPVVREAIASAIDPAFLDQRANEGNGFPSSAIVHPESGLAAVAGDLDGISYDPERAKTLVQQAKADGWDGKLRVVAYNTPDRVELSLAVEAQLEAVGIDVSVDNQNTVNDFIKKIRVDGAFDLAVWGIFVEEAAPWVALDGFRSDSAQNLGGYKSPEMDAALIDLKHASTDDQVGTALTRIQEVWNQTLPAVSWAAAEDVIIWNDDVRGLDFSQDTLVYFDDVYRAG